MSSGQSGSSALFEAHGSESRRNARVRSLDNVTIEVERHRSANDRPAANQDGRTLLDSFEVCERVDFGDNDRLGSWHC